MVVWTLLAAAGVALAASIAFFAVARAFLARPLTADGRFGAALLAGWWTGIGAYGLLVGGLLNLLAAIGHVPLDVFEAARGVSIVVLCGSLACLTSYFAFLYLGDRRVVGVVVALYVAIYSFIQYVFASRDAASVHVGAWHTHLLWSPPAEGLPFAIVLLSLALPQVVGAAWYFALSWRLESPTQRYRARVVAGSIVAWFAGIFLAQLARGDLAAFLTGPVMGLASAGATLLAYRPPVLVRRWLGVESLGDQSPTRIAPR